VWDLSNWLIREHVRWYQRPGSGDRRRKRPVSCNSRGHFT
jgi:hypothetical protein